MKNTALFPWTIWISSALVLVLLASCQEKEYLEEDLERFEDSITGSGRVRYAENRSQQRRNWVPNLVFTNKGKEVRTHGKCTRSESPY